MQNNLFIDTNIILDLLDDTRVFHQYSKKLIEQSLYNNVTLAISDDIITTVYYLSQKNIPREKLLGFINFLNKNFEIVVFTENIIDKAVKICLENKNYDFEDSLQAICAKENNFFTIVTNDKKFPKIEGITLLCSKDCI